MQLVVWGYSRQACFLPPHVILHKKKHDQLKIHSTDHIPLVSADQSFMICFITAVWGLRVAALHRVADF